MPTERLSMRKTREILRLKWQQGRTHREIARGYLRVVEQTPDAADVPAALAPIAPAPASPSSPTAAAPSSPTTPRANTTAAPTTSSAPAAATKGT